MLFLDDIIQSILEMFVELIYIFVFHIHEWLQILRQLLLLGWSRHISFEKVCHVLVCKFATLDLFFWLVYFLHDLVWHVALKHISDRQLSLGPFLSLAKQLFTSLSLHFFSLKFLHFHFLDYGWGLFFKFPSDVAVAFSFFVWYSFVYNFLKLVAGRLSNQMHIEVAMNQFVSL